jgi:hypothetical protein
MKKVFSLAVVALFAFALTADAGIFFNRRNHCPQQCQQCQGNNCQQPSGQGYNQGPAQTYPAYDYNAQAPATTAVAATPILVRGTDGRQYYLVPVEQYVPPAATTSPPASLQPATPPSQPKIK